MTVINGKLKTNSSKLLLHETHGLVTFDAKSKAYIEWDNGSEFVVVEKAGQKIIADKLVPQKLVHVGDPYSKFNNLKFSPKGNFLTYEIVSWGGSINVYDILNNKILTNFASVLDSAEFTADEKYYYTCNEPGMADGNVAVFSTKTGKATRDLMQGKRVNKCLGYNPDTKSLEYELLNGNKIETYTYYPETDKLVIK